MTLVQYRGMKLDKKLTQATALGLGLYLLVTSPLEVALITFGVAAVIVGMTHHLEAAILVLAAPILIKLVNKVNEPFQVKDAPSIVARLQEVRTPGPLAPKINEPTGVLASPEILSSENVVSMKELAAEAVPAASIPAAAKARVAIYTPEEQVVPATEMQLSGPVANPILQNGPDLDAVLSALKVTGASATGPADVQGVDGNAGVAGNAGDAF
jgi:hypothetical protein